jgi:hypothetical protein
MRLLQLFFTTLWGIGYVGNGILFLHIEWTYLREGWIQIFNPLLHIQVILTLLSTSLFWLFLVMAVVGYYLTAAIERQINTKREKTNVKPGKTSSNSTPAATNVKAQVQHSPSRQAVKNDLTTDPLIKQQIELLEWAIQSSQKVQFNYENHDGSRVSHTVAPIQIKTIAGALCLEAHCHSRKSKINFVVKQIGKINFITPSMTSLGASSPHLEEVKPKPSSNTSRTTQRAYRTYTNYSTTDLETTAESDWSNVDLLNDIHHELGFRSRKKARRLREEIANRLAQLQDIQLQDTHFVWPATTVHISSQNLPSETFKYDEGLLRHYGYKVGIYSLSQSERLKILDSIFLDPLIPMDNHQYLNEWGDPKTSGRLKKLAMCIASFTRNAKRRNNQNLSKAIQDWETDLAYLKKTYYDNRFSFGWPHT